MADPSPAFQRSRVVWRFHSSGSAGKFTWPFDDFPPAERRVMWERSACDTAELPAVASFRSQALWVLLTTERLVWSDPKGIHSVRWGAIAAADGAPLWCAKRTGSLHPLHVTTENGAVHELELESGAPFMGFLNVLMWLARRNR